MLKTGVFVWLTVNCKSLNFCSVDILSAQLYCPMDYFTYCSYANSTHLPYSSFARNFEFSNLVIRILWSTKSQILQFYCFQILLSKKVGVPWPPWPPRVCRPCFCWKNTFSLCFFSFATSFSSATRDLI